MHNMTSNFLMRKKQCNCTLIELARAFYRIQLSVIDVGVFEGVAFISFRNISF